MNSMQVFEYKLELPTEQFSKRGTFLVDPAHHDAEQCFGHSSTAGPGKQNVWLLLSFTCANFMKFAVLL